MKKNDLYRSPCLILYLMIFAFSLNLIAEDIIDNTVSPHGEEGKCHYCHNSRVVDKNNVGFRKSSEEEVCIECHIDRGANMTDYLKDMLPNVAAKSRLIEYLSKHPDFSCHSCHNVMCLANSRKELRYRNPHIQLDKEGKSIKKTCLFCHTVTPTKEMDETEKVNKRYGLRYDLEYLCIICHVMSSRKKGCSGKKMSAEMIKKKEQFEKKYDVVLPLGPSGTVICASCHNPHQAGVSVGKSEKTKLPDNHRLVVEDSWQMCTACHTGKY